MYQYNLNNAHKNDNHGIITTDILSKTNKHNDNMNHHEESSDSLFSNDPFFSNSHTSEGTKNLFNLIGQTDNIDKTFQFNTNNRPKKFDHTKSSFATDDNDKLIKPIDKGKFSECETTSISITTACASEENSRETIDSISLKSAPSELISDPNEVKSLPLNNKSPSNTNNNNTVTNQTISQDHNITNSFAFLPKKKNKPISNDTNSRKGGQVKTSNNSSLINANANMILSESITIPNSFQSHETSLSDIKTIDSTLQNHQNLPLTSTTTSLSITPNKSPKDINEDNNKGQMNTAKIFGFRANSDIILCDDNNGNQENEAKKKLLLDHEPYDKDLSILPQQNLIRKNKKTDKRGQIHELLKNSGAGVANYSGNGGDSSSYTDHQANTNLVSKSEGDIYIQLNGYYNIIKDPLAKFDIEHLMIISSSLDDNELENAMPVTYNNNTDLYTHKITEINISKPIQKFFNSAGKEDNIQNVEEPRCLMANQNELIIGSNKGKVYIFDLITEKHKFTLSLSKNIKYGSVTCLDILYNKLLVGYENGQIIIWDYSSKTQLKEITDIHKASIICIKIIKPEPLMFISIDCVGNVVLIDIEKVLMYRKVEIIYIFSQSSHINMFDMKILNRDVTNFKKYNIIGDEEIIIAFSSLKTIHFITLEPISKGVRTIYKFNKPNFVKENMVPSISWCNNIYNTGGQKNKNYILVGWGNSLSLLEFDSTGRETRIKIEGLIKMNFDIIFSTLISQNLVFCIAEENDANNVIHSIHIIHCSEFQKTIKESNNNINSQLENINIGNITQNNDNESNNNPNSSNNNSENAIVIYHEYLDPSCEIIGNNHIKDQKGNFHIAFHNSISLVHEINESIIVGKKGIYKIKVITWNEFLDELVENKSWKFFFTMSLAILTHSVKELADIPDDDQARINLLFPYLKTKLLIYITENLITRVNIISNSNNDKGFIIDNDPEIIEATKCIIDFCIEANMEDFLFLDIKKIFKTYHLNELFLKTLEPFIKSNKIKTIPTDFASCYSPLREIIYYYASSKQNKKDLIQQLISNLNIDNIDIDDIMTICLELNLITSFIYICTQANEFIKPLNIFIMKALREQNQDDMINYSTRCLWYIKMCFKGRVFGKDTHKMIPIDQWKSIMSQIIEFFMIDEYLKILFSDANISYAINIILIIFQGNAYHTLSSSESVNEANAGKRNGMNDQAKSKSNSIKYELNILPEVNAILKPQSNVFIMNNIHYRALCKLLDLLTNKTESSDSKDRNRLYIAFLCSKIIQNDIDHHVYINEEYCLEVIDYILKMHTKLDELIIINFKLTLPENITNLQQERILRDTINEDYLLLSKSNMIHAILKYAEKTLLNSEEYIKKIMRDLEISSFVEPLCYLLALQKDYTKVIDKYLQKNTPKNLQQKLIDWILNTMNKIEVDDVIKLEEIKDYILKRMSELVLINPEQTKELINRYFKNKEKEVIYKLNAEPELQLLLLEKILQERKSNQRLDEELFELHIYLLCKSSNKKKRKEVLFKIQQYDINSANCLKYCEEFKIKDATAYLEEKFGGPDNICRAIQLKYEIFEDYLKKYMKNKDIQIITKECELKIKKKLKSMVDMLMMHNDINEKNNWVIYLEKIAHIDQELLLLSREQPQSKKYEKLYLICEELIEDMLFEIIKNIQFNQILNEIQNPSSNLQSDLLIKIFRKIISNNLFSHKLTHDTKILTQYDITLLTNLKLIPNNMKGQILKTNCDGCLKPIKHRKCYCFACGHTFHLNECIKENLCYLCIKSEQSTVSRHMMGKYNKKIDFIKRKLNTTAIEINEIKEDFSLFKEDERVFMVNHRKNALKFFDNEKNHDVALLFEYASQKIHKVDVTKM